MRLYERNISAKRVHFFFFNELATVGLGDTFPHGGAETGFFLKQTQNRLLHQMLYVGTRFAGDLRQPRLLGCEAFIVIKGKCRSGIGASKFLLLSLSHLSLT